MVQDMHKCVSNTHKRTCIDAYVTCMYLHMHTDTSMKMHSASKHPHDAKCKLDTSHARKQATLKTLCDHMPAYTHCVHVLTCMHTYTCADMGGAFATVWRLASHQQLGLRIVQYCAACAEL